MHLHFDLRFCPNSISHFAQRIIIIMQKHGLTNYLLVSCTKRRKEYNRRKGGGEERERERERDREKKQVRKGLGNSKVNDRTSALKRGIENG